MRILVTGASGLIGTQLMQVLRERGDDVLALVRRAPSSVEEVAWDPSRHMFPDRILPEYGHVDAIINLAGAPVAQQWTDHYRREIRSSRVDATQTCACYVAEHPETVLINGSAVGFYGDRPGEVLNETAPPSTSFLASVVQSWEAAAGEAVRAGARVVFLRAGIVLSPDGGALAKMLPLIKLGLAGPLGSGRQVWPWITLDDEVAAIVHALDTPTLHGPVNLVSPVKTTQLDLVRVLAAAYRRPAFVPAPAFALRLALGSFADELLADQHVVPTKLVDSGFEFAHSSLREVTAWLASVPR